MDTLHCELVGEKTQLCDKWRNVWYSANMSLIEGDLRIGHHHRHNHSVLPGRYAAVNDHWGLSRDDIMFFWPFTLWSLFLGLSYGFKNWGYFKWQFPLEKWWQAIWFGGPNVQKYLSEISMPASKSNHFWLMSRSFSSIILLMACNQVGLREGSSFHLFLKPRNSPHSCLMKSFKQLTSLQKLY